MINQAYQQLSELKLAYKELDRNRKKAAYDQKKAAKRLSQLTKIQKVKNDAIN